MSYGYFVISTCIAVNLKENDKQQKYCLLKSTPIFLDFPSFHNYSLCELSTSYVGIKRNSVKLNSSGAVFMQIPLISPLLELKNFKSRNKFLFC